jgi:hypothetical protein
MADTQQAPHSATQPTPALEGSMLEAQEAILGLLEPEKETPETEEAAPEEVEESTEETQDESSEEVSEDEEDSVEDEKESEEESEEDEVEEEPDVYAVKVDGEELEVSLDELISGYSRHSDYTRKTQELSSERGEIAELKQRWSEEISQSQAERQQYIDAIGQFVQQSMVGLEQYTNTDWETLREEDPIAFVTKKDEFRDAQERVRQAQAQQGIERQKQEQEFAKVKQMALQEEHKRLITAVPEWNDPEKRGTLAKELSSYALSQGFKKEELQELIDHRSLIVLMKAQKYDALQKSDVKSKKLKNKPKVIRSGKGTNKKSDTAKAKRIASMKRLKESGHVNDSVALFEDFVDI